MLIKRAFLSGERDGELLVQRVLPGSLVKTASCVLPEVERFVYELKPDDRYTYVLVNAMGYSEYFGANSNTDYYGYNPHIDFNGLLHDWPGIGENRELDIMKAKNWPHGYPCFYNAAAYAHHRNTDPVQLGFGDVVLSVANPVMKRIELIIRVSNEEAIKKGHHNILSRIRNGERCDVSMGARVPYDACSVCTDWDTFREAMAMYDPKLHAHKGIPVLHYHKGVAPIRGLARTMAERCECMRTQRGKILPDGRKVFVYNDFPRFFDISFVWIGADKTARVMWHLSGNNPLSKLEQESAKLSQEKLSSVILTKVAYADLRKLSEMDKEIDGGVAREVHAATDCDARIPADVLRSLVPACGGVRQALSTLASCGVVLKPEEFQCVVAAGDPHRGGEILESLRNGCTFDTARSGINDSLSVDPGLVAKDVPRRIVTIIRSRSSFGPFLAPRIHGHCEVTPTGELNVMSGGPLDRLSDLYNGYRLSMVELAPKLADAFDASLLPEEVKYSSIGVSDAVGLLLTTGTLVSLLSSHLRKKEEAGKELGVVGKFIAQHPSLTAAATAALGLRLAMGLQSPGGIAGAAKDLVNVARSVV